ncbi:MAG: hypothetical protein C4539_05950 [Ignavibacteriales bacterium]|nr:MAG: hypothetical protein C4539_05950 [Ignavibacteriales bacterium]
MLTYLIDGNNLIGKIKQLRELQKKDKQGVREKLALRLDTYFSNKNQKVILFFDGFKAEAIHAGKIKIVYSENKSADEELKNQIEITKNKRTITLVTSDSNLAQFGKVCGCTVIGSDKFAMELFGKQKDLDEDELAKSISQQEIKNLFGV